MVASLAANLGVESQGANGIRLVESLAVNLGVESQAATKVIRQTRKENSKPIKEESTIRKAVAILDKERGRGSSNSRAERSTATAESVVLGDTSGQTARRYGI